VNHIETIRTFFLAQSTARKITLVAGISLIVIVTTSLSFWAMSPRLGILFSHLDQADANQVLTQLEQANIAYQVRNQGRDVWIDHTLIDKTRIKLLSNDTPFAHTTGFELFDKTDFGMTDFSQKINYQRALQGELERTISSIDEVKQARVQLTLPESHLFQEDKNAPRVAVTLHLSTPLSRAQIKSIQHLITASVANLSPENVVIIDQNGNGLTTQDDDSSDTHFTAKKTIELYLNEKVMQMLQHVFPHDNVLVKIDATLNYDELQREKEKPQQNGMVTHEKETQHTTLAKTDKKHPNQDFFRERSYQFGHEKEHFTRANGTLERLTISVLLPKTTPNTSIIQIERLVKSIVGFDARRGDVISVEALAVTQNTTIDVTPVSQITPPTTLSPYLALMGLLAICGLTVIVRIRLRVQQRQRLLNELNEWLLEHD
jgi:flagellar M-ring protein FliF